MIFQDDIECDCLRINSNFDRDSFMIDRKGSIGYKNDTRSIYLKYFDEISEKFKIQEHKVIFLY